MVERGGDLNVLNKTSETPLYIAAKNKISVKTLKYLIENKGEINKGEKVGYSYGTSCSAFQKLCGVDIKPSFLKYLIDKKANITTKGPNGHPHEYLVKKPELVTVFLCQIDKVYFRKKNTLTRAVGSIFRDYQNCNLYRPDRHQYFGVEVQSFVKILLISFKFISRKMRNIFPKPLIYKLVNLIFQPNPSLPILEL